MHISVLVPSYRRPADLARCLKALAAQERMAEQIIVVMQSNDKETLAVAESWQNRLKVKLVLVETPGQVQALNAGLKCCVGDIVAITDDDAAPRPDWLLRIEAHFMSDPKIGGVGGRDWVHQNGSIETGCRTLVGRVLWFGRIVGNHHLGAGQPRDVDILKGANCAFRMSAIRPIGFDKRLRGAGAQVHNDMAVSLGIQRAGWRLVYDPATAVDHFPAPRQDEHRGNSLSPEAVFDLAYNFTLAIAGIRHTWRRKAAYIWQGFIGNKSDPGFVWALFLAVERGPCGLQLWQAARAGRNAADKAVSVS
jgi:cellulose synthase/poly-beta-1,6-N-acetylglucosamine synthase-like glycosyltransferase